MRQLVMLAEGRILGVVVGLTAPLFLAVLVVHVAAALTALAGGVVAALSTKGGVRHIRSGRLFYRSLVVVFVTAVLLTVMRPRQDWYLALIGAVALGAAFVGVRHRRLHRPGDTGHIVAMGGSLAAMITAFYVDNGPHLPVWDHLPRIVFWFLPGAIAIPLIARTVARHRATVTADRDQAADHS